MSQILKKLHKVPYYSQLSNLDWKERGFQSVEDAKYWEKRSCGIACMKMVLDMYDDHKGRLFAELIKEMEQKGVYKDGVGCVHQGIADEFNNRSIDSQRVKISEVQKIKELIDQDNILIISIGAGFVDGKKNGHLVPVVGYVEEGGVVTSIIVHHTSSLVAWQWPEKEIETERFMNHFSGNAIRVRLYK